MQVVRRRGVITELRWPAGEELASGRAAGTRADRGERMIYNLDWIIFFTPLAFLRIQNEVCTRSRVRKGSVSCEDPVSGLQGGEVSTCTTVA